jgi:tetratricopeptide (TPR) repeat protein
VVSDSLRSRTAACTLFLATAQASVFLIARPACSATPELQRPSQQGTGTSEQEDTRLTRARVIVAAAESLFVAGHYAAALAEYSRAYDVLRGHPRQYWVLHNLAACNERLFQYDVALNLYEEYLKRAPRSEEDRAEVQVVIRTLRSLLGTLVVETSVDAEVWVDNRRLGAAPGRWLVPGGRHVVEVRAALFETQRREVQLGAAQVHRLRFDLQRLSTYRGPSRGYFWTAAGLSAAAAAAGATFGLLALDASSDGREKASLSVDSSEESDRTRQLSLAADICFGTAVLFGATAGVLFFVTDWSDSTPPPVRTGSPRPKRTAKIALGPRGDAGIALELEF